GLTIFARRETDRVARDIGNYSLQNTDLGIRYRMAHLRMPGGSVAYLEASFNNRSITQSSVRVRGHVYPNPPKAGDEIPFLHVTSRGLGPAFGAGFDKPFGRRLGLNGSVLFT